MFRADCLAGLCIRVTINILHNVNMYALGLDVYLASC